MSSSSLFDAEQSNRGYILTDDGFCCKVCTNKSGEPVSFTSYSHFIDHANTPAHKELIGRESRVKRVDDPQRIRARLAQLKERVMQQDRPESGAAERIEVEREKVRLEKERAKERRRNGRKMLFEKKDGEHELDLEMTEMAKAMGFSSFS